MKNIIYSKLSTKRSPQYQIRTRIIHCSHDGGEKYVEKESLNKEANQYISTLFHNYLFLKEKLKGFKFPVSTFDGHAFKTEFMEGETLEALIENAKDEEDRRKFLDLFFKSLYSSFGLEFCEHDDIDRHIENLIAKTPTLYSLDLAFSNILLSGNELYLIDYEWIDETSTTEFALFRTYLNSSGTKPGAYFTKYFSGDRFNTNLLREKRFQEALGFEPEFPQKERFSPEKLHQKNKEMKEQIALLNNEIKIIYNSKSWKITTPLRLVNSVKKKIEAKFSS